MAQKDRQEWREEGEKETQGANECESVFLSNKQGKLLSIREWEGEREIESTQCVEMEKIHGHSKNTEVGATE